MKRTLVIGDIHGAFRALEQVLERCQLQKEDRLIFLGDYVDGWSQSKEVIDRLLALAETHDCIFIRGNHDTWCENWLRASHADPTWLFHGGASTLRSYELCDDDTRRKHLGFFGRMRDYYIDTENNLFIHAGFTSMHGPEKETYSSNYSWDRTLWEMALTVDDRIEKDSLRFPKRLKLFREILIGHTPTVNYGVFKPMRAANVWNVDTGAAFDGMLSVMDAGTKEFWQSDTVRTLYPGEKGRNRD